ncbi:MAG: hypothetical protein J5828_01485 [Desulfovibrionaceae bacterium]|nr:hypothetical protein [Desulfovibrionaceae bacterium]
MAGKPKRTKAQVLEAIRGSKGLRTVILARLGVSSYDTLRSYLERWPETREALEREEEKLLDDAEWQLFEQARAGNLSAIMYLLNNKGKKRGYSWNGKDNQQAGEKNENSGVLKTPGLMDEEQWETLAQK